MRKYGYILMGGGLYTSVFIWYTRKNKERCLVVEKRNHIDGSMYCEDVEGIHIHKYGAHVFHMGNRKVWEFMSSLAEFNRCTNSPAANYKGQMYNMPFNMNTLSCMWGISTPGGARAITEKQKAETIGEPRNLEEQTIRLVGRELCEKLIKGYTGKWQGRDYRELPAFIVKCISVRYIYNNNYSNDSHQGTSVGGYSIIVRKLFEGCNIETSINYLRHREHYDSLGGTVVYTSTIDAFYGYRFGRSKYRNLCFESQSPGQENHQGMVMVNYTNRGTPYTRVIEHKHFEPGIQSKTMITREYPVSWQEDIEPYYPVNDQKNQELHQGYEELVGVESHALFGGCLGEYKYYDMDKVIESAIDKAEGILG